MTLSDGEGSPVASSSPKPAGAVDDARLFINREISWLAFNARVLDQACDDTWPLLERLKFLAIFGSNLDEFFMIRVSGLHEQLEALVPTAGADGLSVAEQLEHVRHKVLADVTRADAVFERELLPALTRAGIRIRPTHSLSASEQEWLRAYFRKSVFPVLTPLAVDPLHPFPFLSNLSLSLAVEVEEPITLEWRFARVKVPESLPRFVPVGHEPADPHAKDAAHLEFVRLEDVIASNLSDLFPGMRIVGSHAFRVTRDMDFEILEQEADDLLALIDREVRRRRFGAGVRLEVAPGVPERIRTLLLDKLELDSDDLYECGSLLGFASLFALASLPRPDLRDPLLPPRVPPEWAAHDSPFESIREHDILLHHPYESFAPVLDVLSFAADDPNVLAIKMTLYRAGSNAEVVRTLVRAAENGKQVAVSIELKARFDEENNIGWARAMERAGVHVFYGSRGLKTHAKALLVVRREGDELRRYVHLSTGNYNASTAKLYTDVGLLTADAEIGDDLSELFNALSGFSRSYPYRKLAVAPTRLRHAFLEKIGAQTERARSGLAARIFAKLNALVDPEIIRALYAASQVGVEVDLVVRGICCLRPRMPGVSDRIRVRSLVGRFLEHERLYVFGPSGDEEFFLASADWMPRNLDRRVELLFPVTSPVLCDRLRRECHAPIDLDTCRVYEMDAEGRYRRTSPGTDGVRADAQVLTWSVVSKR
jgi:polyphosphate kinase